MKQVRRVRTADSERGFTLVEALIAVLILGFGLLWGGQIIFVALSSASLARSKASAALIAQNRLEFLADLYRRDPDVAEMSEGNHLGDQVQVLGGGTTLNRYTVSWAVSPIPDPRGGVLPQAKLVHVTVVPTSADGAENIKVRLNATVSVSSIFYSGAQ